MISRPSGFVRSLTRLTLILLTWRIWWAPNNASKWPKGFNSVFKGLSRFWAIRISCVMFIRGKEKGWWIRQLISKNEVNICKGLVYSTYSNQSSCSYELLFLCYTKCCTTFQILRNLKFVFFSTVRLQLRIVSLMHVDFINRQKLYQIYYN